MASNIRHLVEPTFGWLFVVVLIVALCAALAAWARPAMEENGPGRIQVERAR